jgi:hypothetical protein
VERGMIRRIGNLGGVAGPIVAPHREDECKHRGALCHLGGWRSPHDALAQVDSRLSIHEERQRRLASKLAANGGAGRAGILVPTCRRFAALANIAVDAGQDCANSLPPRAARPHVAEPFDVSTWPPCKPREMRSSSAGPIFPAAKRATGFAAPFSWCMRYQKIACSGVPGPGLF